jgi:CRISPR/Cas system-associated exonuclease Cas4 (RecB family)
MNNFISPASSQIQSLSPYQLKAFKECPKKLSYSLDPVFNHIKNFSTFSSLGNIVHQILSESFERLVTEPNSNQRKEWFNNYWKKCEDSELNSLKSQLPFANIPKPHTWPKYQLIKGSCERKVVGFPKIKSGKDRIRTESNIDSGAYSFHEKYFEDSVLGFKGKPDLISKNSTGYTLIDYKTGMMDENRLHDVTSQLHFYKVLVEIGLSIKITELQIDIINQDVIVIPISMPLIEDLKKSVRSALTSINEGKVAAIVSKESCTYCVYKGVCKDFWNERDKFEGIYPLAISGEVMEIIQSETSKYQTLILKDSLEIPTFDATTTYLTKVSSDISFNVGNRIIVWNNLKRNHLFHIETSWNTLIIKI